MEYIDELRRNRNSPMHINRILNAEYFKKEEFAELIEAIHEAIANYNRYKQAIANFQQVDDYSGYRGSSSYRGYNDEDDYYLDDDNDHPLLDHYIDEMADAQSVCSAIVDSIIGKIPTVLS